MAEREGWRAVQSVGGAVCPSGGYWKVMTGGFRETRMTTRTRPTRASGVEGRAAHLHSPAPARHGVAAERALSGRIARSRSGRAETRAIAPGGDRRRAHTRRA